MIQQTILLSVLAILLSHFSFGQSDYRSDLAEVIRLLESQHPSLKSQSIERFDEIKNELGASGALAKSEFVFKAIKVVSTLNDPHTQIKNLHEFLDLIPLHIQSSDDNWVIEATTKENKEILGGQLISINGVDIENVVSVLSEIIPCDNSGCLKTLIPQYIYFPELLEEMGLGNNKTETLVGYKTTTGEVKSKTLNLIDLSQWAPNSIYREQNKTHLINQNKNDPAWVYYDTSNDFLYVRISSFAGKAKHYKEVAKTIKGFSNDENTKILVDLRNNAGGSVQLAYPILRALIETKARHNFLATNHNTFSAAIVFSELLKSYLNPVHLGAEYGDTRNHFSENASYDLPRSGMRLSIATQYYHNTNDHSAAEIIGVPADLNTHLTDGDPIVEYVISSSRVNLEKAKPAKQEYILSIDEFPSAYRGSYDFYLAQQAGISYYVFGDKSTAVDLCKDRLKVSSNSPYLLGMLGVIRLRSLNLIGGLPKVLKASKQLKKTHVND